MVSESPSRGWCSHSTSPPSPDSPSASMSGPSPGSYWSRWARLACGVATMMHDGARWVMAAVAVLLLGCGPKPAECVRRVATQAWNAAPSCAACAEHIAEVVYEAKACNEKDKRP